MSFIVKETLNRNSVHLSSNLSLRVEQIEAHGVVLIWIKTSRCSAALTKFGCRGVEEVGLYLVDLVCIITRRTASAATTAATTTATTTATT